MKIKKKLMEAVYGKSKLGNPPKPRGGARSGAGRKPGPKKAIIKFSVPAEYATVIKDHFKKPIDQYAADLKFNDGCRRGGLN